MNEKCQTTYISSVLNGKKKRKKLNSLKSLKYNFFVKVWKKNEKKKKEKFKVSTKGVGMKICVK